MTAPLAVTGNAIPAAPPDAVEKIRELEVKIREREQIQPQMEHILHAGMYARTCRLDAGVVITSVMIKIPTMLIIHGGTYIFAGDRWHRIDGYQAMAAGPGRKQVYLTFRPTEITMLFPTQARTVEEAEAEFTDETDQLLSRHQESHDLVTVTGVTR